MALDQRDSRNFWLVAWEMLRAASPQQLEEYCARGVYINDVVPGVGRMRFSVDAVLDHMRGRNECDPRDWYSIESAWRQIQRGRQRLPYELDQAYQAMLHASGFPDRLHDMLRQGIRVQCANENPIAWDANGWFNQLPEMVECRIRTVLPLEVFTEMREREIRIDPMLESFAAYVMREDVHRRAFAGRNAPIENHQAHIEMLYLMARQREVQSAGQRGFQLNQNISNVMDLMANAPYPMPPHGHLERSRRELESVKEHQSSKKRAVALLERVVTPAEFSSYKTEGHINLATAQWRYQIQACGQTRLYNLKNGEFAYSACLQLNPSGTLEGMFINELPEEDRIVTEYLLIQNDEPRYLETANLFPVLSIPSPARTGNPPDHYHVTELGTWPTGVNVVHAVPSAEQIVTTHGTVSPTPWYRIFGGILGGISSGA